MPTVRPPAPDAVRPLATARRPETPTEPATEPWPEVDWMTVGTRLRLDPPAGWYAAMKPAIEIGAAVLLLPVALVAIAAAWVLVRATSAGPGFYVQTRVGRGGRPFGIVKVRTMFSDASVAKNIEWAQKNDRRITPVGKILRVLHIDELPQLFNVLKGEMSLVGPRPERPEVIASKGLHKQVPGYDHRTAVHPGVTGLAQVQLPADTDTLSVRHKVCYDLYYLMNRSLWLDLRLCAATALKAFLSPPALRRFLLLPTREQVVAQVLQLVQPAAETCVGAATPPPKSAPATA